MADVEGASSKRKEPPHKAVKVMSGSSGKPDVGSEFRRAYLILALFAGLIVLGALGTNTARGREAFASATGSATAEDDSSVVPVGAGDSSLEDSYLEAKDLALERSRSAPDTNTISQSNPGADSEDASFWDDEVEESGSKKEAAAPPQEIQKEKTSAPANANKKAAKPPKAPKAKSSGGSELDFSVPQHICPGSPTKKGLGSGGPRQNKEVIRQILEHLGDGEVPETTSDIRKVKSGDFKYDKIECPFLTRECANVKYRTGKQAAAKMKQSGAKWNQTAQMLPDIPPGSLGSCALIGNSDNMMRHEWGKHIDAHDTVIRHNTPIGKYAKHVGRKATIVWVKGRYKGRGSASASLAYLVPKNVDELPKNFRKNGKPILIRGIGAKPLDKTKRLLYHLQGANLRRKHPTGGYSRPLNVIASKLCTRVDLYGFGSRNGSGKYFQKSAKVRPAHIMSYEHWTFRYMMSKGKLCVYGD